MAAASVSTTLRETSIKVILQLGVVACGVVESSACTHTLQTGGTH